MTTTLPNDTPHMLGDEIANWVKQRTEAILNRYFSGPVIPRFQAGHCLGPDTYSDLVRLLGHLHALGVTQLAGVRVEDWIRRVLPTVDGPRTQTFGSLALAATLLEWGRFEGNPLLEGLSADQRQNLAAACDTTHIYKADGTIGEWSANYWMVLARAEFARQRLGLLTDTTILEAALEECRRLLLKPADAFFDDSATGVGRYDSYSMHALSLLRPLAGHLPAAPLRAHLERDVRMLETLAMENGAFVAWGRSIGILSIIGTLGQAVEALHDGLGQDTGRLWALAANAWAQVPAWYQDDLIAAHRHRMTDGYRGPQRLLQMSLDCLAALAGTARTLLNLQSPPPPCSPVFPPRDDLIRFDHCNAGAWMFRNAHMAFQLPFVSAWLGADYVPWLHSPGLFENPVDCPMRFGVPVVLVDGVAFGPGERPASVAKAPGALTLTYESLMEEVAGGWMPHPEWRRLRADLSLTWRVDGDAVHFEQRLALGQAPQGVVISIPQAQRPLTVKVVACRGPVSQDVVVVDGMSLYRSCWSQLTAIHQLHLQPATEVFVHFVVQPT